MNRFAPAVRALCERVRRPTSIRLLLGTALIAPAALITNGTSSYMKTSAMGTLPPVVVSSKEPAANGGQRLIGRPVGQSTTTEAKPNVSEAAGEGAATEYAQEYRISGPLASQIHEAAVANGISPRTAFGLVRAESGFRSRAISPVGAVGLTQIMPATARWLKPGTTRGDLMNPKFNLNLGFQYLRSLIDDYRGNERLALTAFNRGPGTVNRLLKRGRDPDNGYADKVLTGRSAKHVSLMNAKFGRRR